MFIFSPGLQGMTSHFFMAVITGVVIIAALEFYSNYIQGRMIMNTAGLVINGFAFYNDVRQISGF